MSLHLVGEHETRRAEDGGLLEHAVSLKGRGRALTFHTRMRKSGAQLREDQPNLARREPAGDYWRRAFLRLIRLVVLEFAGVGYTPPAEGAVTRTVSSETACNSLLTPSLRFDRLA